MTRNYLTLYFFGICACFVANTVARKAIVGGQKAKEDQFPYQVTILEKGGDDVCGGGIIAEQYILTAAHCVLRYGQFANERRFILAGSNDLHKRENPAVVAEIDKFLVPIEYNPKYFISDIAVIKLKHPLTFSHFIHKMDLPERQEKYTGKIAKIAGFGWHWIKIENSNVQGGNNDTQLRFAKVDVLGQVHKCYDKTTDAEKQICGRTKQHFFHKQDVAVCFGDSGSPLVLHDKTVIGILSTSPGTCSEKETGAQYTRVTRYLDFIHDAMLDRPHEYIITHVLQP